MPCYEVRMMSVEFQAKHLDLLKDAIRELKWNHQVSEGATKVTIPRPGGGITLDLENQRAELPSFLQNDLNQLKQAYSNQAIARVAKVKGWMRQAETPTRGVLRRM